MTYQPDLLDGVEFLPRGPQIMSASPDDGDAPLEPQPGLDGDDVLAPSSLADVLDLLTDGGYDHPRLAALKSGLRTVARVIGRPLQDLPADPQALRQLLATASPASVGKKPSTWKQDKSNALCALRLVGVQVVASRDVTPLSEAWSSLFLGLPAKGHRIRLSRLVRHLSRRDIKPDEVTEETFQGFLDELELASLKSDPGKSYRQAVRAWNEAVKVCPEWPQLLIEAPKSGRQFALDWSELPASFTAEVDAFLATKQECDPLSDDDYARPVRPATTKGRRSSLRVIAGALVCCGRVKKESLTSLTILTEVENVRAALRYLRDERSGGRLTEGHLNHVWLLRTIARHWLRDEAKTAELKALIASLSAQIGGPVGGIRDKNRERLRQFDIPENVEALVSLPFQVLKEFQGKTKRSHNDAVKLMYATLLAIVTYLPVRSKNLYEIKIGDNLIDFGRGSKRVVRIHLPAHETKTRRDYDAPLPQHVYPLLDAWLQRGRPIICGKPSSLLFPNARGEVRSSNLSKRFSRFIERETGLEMHVHLFRHLAAKLYLQEDPNGIEVVRQLLGHTETKTTLRAYAEMQTDPAFRRFEDTILGVKAPKNARGRK